MVSPPLICVIKWVFPFVTLNNLNFLNVPGFIAGTSNQLFEHWPDWYDICCELDNVRMNFSKSKDGLANVHQEEEPWFELDNDFIQRIITRIKVNSISNEEIINMFAAYT